MGEYHGCSLRDTTPYCWGPNWNGEVGVGDTLPRPSPALVSESLRFSAIAVGSDAVCAVEAVTGLSWCWGNGGDGFLGRGANRAASYEPVRTASNEPFRSISRAFSTCTLTRTDQLYCWGSNAWALTNNNPVDLNQPDPTALFPTRTWKQVVGGAGFWCGIDATNDRVACWGLGRIGQTGNGSFQSITEPVYTSDTSPYSKLTAGERSVCGLTGTTIRCWGSNVNGLAGKDPATHWAFSSPSPVSGGHSFVDVASGSYFACGLDTGGSAWCWGNGARGQLGNGADSHSFVPVRVQSASGVYPQFASLTAGGFHACGRSAMGNAAMCWGLNSQGQLGENTFNTVLTPTSVSGSYTFAQLEVNQDTACGITSDASPTLYCWGSNRAGNVGDGTLINRGVPTAVVGGPATLRTTTALHRSGSQNFNDLYSTCVLDATDQLWCWGSDPFGSLYSNEPVYVDTPTLSVLFSGTATNLRQYHSDGTTSFAAGFGANDTGIVVAADAHTREPGENPRLCVERKPFGQAFDGSNTACSAPDAASGVGDGDTMTVTLPGLGIYHWRWQVESSIHGYSPYAEFDPDGAVPDYIVDTTTPVASGVSVYEADSTTVVPVNGWSLTSSVVIKANVATYSGATLCAEAKPVDVAFDGTELTCGTHAYTFPTAAPSVTVTNLYEGTPYHARVRAFNGLTTPTASAWVAYGGNSDAHPADRDFAIDSKAPTVGSVFDGLDAPTQHELGGADLDRLSASWNGFSDDGSGILRYEFAMGTSPGAADLKAWTDAGTSTTATAAGLSLQTGTRYYTSVRAVDNVGWLSASVTSPGQLVGPSLSFSATTSIVDFGVLSSEPSRRCALDDTYGAKRTFAVDPSLRSG